MSEPIKQGDLCEVVGGLGRGKSPNVGLRVRVDQLRGEHSQLGRIWRCAGEGVQQLSDAGTYVVTGWADFAASWLRKLPPDQANPQAEQEKREAAL